jgi:ABC-type antimicrobial peptide transport system permease subunit
MRTSTLLARNLTWYWRTNLAVLLGVATAAGVLGGAVLVGDSVRASLHGLVLSRLGNADFAVTRNGFFREALAETLPSSSPVIAMQGMAAHEASGRRAAGVQVYGIDERFWKFQREPGTPPRGRDILMTSALAQELGARAGDDILLRVEKPSAIPLETLHGSKEDVGRTIRLTASGVTKREFSLLQQQGEVRAVYVPLARLQRDLNQAGKVNTILTADTPGIARILKEHYTLGDLGLTLRVLDPPGCLSLESDSTIVSDALARVASSTAQSLGLRAQPVLTYLANRIRAAGREVPYSVVTAIDSDLAPARQDGITLNDWAARDLRAKVGDPVTLEYYVWKSDGRLDTETAQFRLERIVPLAGAAADSRFAPAYPGITESKNLHDWDPPFPLNMDLIRPIDEQYWRAYRTTPKAFVRLARGRELWGTRFGSLTSIRVFPPSEAFGVQLRAALDPSAMGLTVVPVKAQGLQAAQGTTDFGEYFVYFSFFLMVSALLLTGLFFKLGVEQRTREIGVLRALGFSASKIRNVFLMEGALLAIAGAIAGAGVALAYGALILLGLRTWWFDAVGTKLLTLHASLPSLAAGALTGVLTGLAAVVWTLRRLEPVTPRGLLAGGRDTGPRPWRWVTGAIAAVLALALVAAGWRGTLSQTAAFFGAGTLLLIGALLLESAWLHSRGFAAIGGLGTLGLRSLTYRPGRSILCIALIASATFLIVSLDAFRRDDSPAGTGGFSLLAESVLPLIHDPNSSRGREALNIPPLQGVEFVSFRLRPGDDASCLNLYQPRNPRIMAPPANFLRNARFIFQGAVSETRNPWLLLEAKPDDGVIPAIADANSMTYALHRKLGEEFELDGARFRIVAALQDSLFQGELLISEQNFLRLFPDAQGFRFFLINTSPDRGQEVARILGESLSDYGFHVQPAAARLADFHRVKNTYLSTFRALGGLGLILGTLGLAAVLLRNILERRRELALLRAVGYRPQHLRVMVLAENLFLLVAGLATGAGCALVAVAPAVSVRGGHLPMISLVGLLALVLVTGIVTSFIATAVALRSPLLEALRSE